MTKLKTELDPWAEAFRGVRQTVKRPRKIKVLVVTRRGLSTYGAIELDAST